MIHRFHHFKHDRPLVVLDTETTGTGPKTDRIVEVAAVKFTSGEKPTQFHSRINPGVPIPAAATETHGITDKDVREAPAFCQIVRKLIRFLNGSDLAGFNIKRFDLPLLLTEFERCGQSLTLDGRRVIDALEIYHDHERRDLTSAVRLYCEMDHSHAHAALGDVLATAEVLDAQLARYAELPPTIEDLHRQYSPLDLFGRFRLEEGHPVFTFGKYRGQRLEDIARSDPDYLRWMLAADFPEDVLSLLRSALRDAT